MSALASLVTWKIQLVDQVVWMKMNVMFCLGLYVPLIKFAKTLLVHLSVSALMDTLKIHQADQIAWVRNPQAEWNLTVLIPRVEVTTKLDSGHALGHFVEPP